MQRTILLAALGAAALTARAGAQASMTNLGNFFPTSVSADGTTVLGTEFGDVKAYNVASGAFTTLDGISPSSIGDHALSADGSWAAGTDVDGSGFTQMARWDGNAWVTLGGIGGSNGSEMSRGAAISDDGLTVVGNAWWNINFEHAVSWTQGAPGPVDLGALGGGNSHANAVSSDGSIVVGWDEDAVSVLPRPARWMGTTQTYLGSLDPMDPTAEGEANDVSGDGAIIVGESFDGTATMPFRHQNGTMTGLGLAPGFVSGTATAISADGTVILGHNVTTIFSIEAVIWSQGASPERLTDVLADAGASLFAKPGVISDVSADGTVIVGRTAGFPSFGFVAVLGEPPVIYCTAKTNSLGCTPSIGFSGTFPSASDPVPFDVTASMVINNKNGLLFYGIFGAVSIPALGGTLCAQPPLRRTPLQFSFGSPPPDDCSGTFSFDVNDWIQSGGDPVLTPGTTLYGQYWSRDPASSFGVSLTDAIEATVGA